MKLLTKMSLLLTLLIVSATELAYARNFTEDDAKLCKTIGESAALAMEQRQNKDDIGESVEAVAQMDPTTTDFERMYRNMFIALIQDAYTRPRFDTRKERDDEVRRFRNEAIKTCITGVQDQEE